MFDFGTKWKPAQFDVGVSGSDVTGSPVGELSLVVVSGNITTGLADLGLRKPPLGATSVAMEDSFALTMARDRCLAISLHPLAVTEGWHEGGYAVTEMSDGFSVLEFAGSGLPTLLAQATSLDWSSSMRSAAISFAGASAAAVFRESRHRLWLIVETASLPAIQRWFATVKAG